MHSAINMSQSKQAFIFVLLLLSLALCGYLFPGVPKYSSLQSIQGDVLNSYKKRFYGHRDSRRYRVLELKSESGYYVIRIPLIEGVRVIRVGDIVSIMIGSPGNTGIYNGWEVHVNDKLTIPYERIANHEREIVFGRVVIFSLVLASLMSIYGLYCYRVQK